MKIKNHKSSYERIHDAEVILERNGYYTANLWSIDDVKEIFDCNDKLAMEILNDAMTNEGTTEQIWSAIKNVGEDIHNLKTK